MNEEDRKKVFWLLQKYSSFTAWNALGEAYAEFVKAWEYAMEHADFTTHTDWYKRILNGQIAFEKGLPLLREGQRSVFKRSSTGYLHQTERIMVFIGRIMDPEEFDFDWMKNKNEVVEAKNKLGSKAGRVYVATELDEDDDVAPLGRKSVFDPLWGPFNFPPTLPEVPTPSDTTVNTFDETPVTGIWEPEWAIPTDPLSLSSAVHRVSSWLSNPFADSLAQKSDNLGEPENPSASRMEKGCMNYLLASSIAPKYQDGELDPAFHVRWRLVWADNRYKDGTIPEAEKEYLLDAQIQPTGVPLTGRLRAEPNDIVPKTGWWHTPALKGDEGFRYFEQGQHFPDVHTTQYGGVIWGFDPNEQKG